MKESQDSQIGIFSVIHNIVLIQRVSENILQPGNGVPQIIHHNELRKKRQGAN